MYSNEDRQNNRSNNIALKIAANSSHVFCIDEKELLVFDVNFVLLSRLAVPNAIQLVSIACSNDGTLITNARNGDSFFKFTPNEQLQYVKTVHTKNISPDTKHQLSRARMGYNDGGRGGYYVIENNQFLI